MKKYEKLTKACEKYPTIELSTNGKAKIYKPPKVRAKNGFIQKFCK